MTYMATSINESPTLSEKAGAVLADVRGRAVKFDDNGDIVLCAVGETAIGIGIMTNDRDIPVGADVDIQIKDIGYVRAGSVITKGAELTPGADGKLTPASDGDFVCAIALEAAAKADIYIRARLTAYAKGGSNVAKVTGETELRDAIAAAAEGVTVKLTADMSLTDQLAVDKTMTLDLGGHTVTTASDIWAKSGTLTIKNGTVEAAADAFVVGDYLGGKETATGDSTLIIGEGVTVNVTGDNCNCVYVRSSDHEASVVTAGNLTSAAGSAIQGNGISRGNVTVTGGRVVSENDTAIYHPQDGVLTITGGEITGKVGIEIRAGELNVSGGTITGYVEAFSGFEPNGNGTTDVYGAAVAVSQHTTNKATHVNVNGGTLTGFYALYEEDIQDETVDGISLAVSGGTFNGKVYSENVTGFISGGKFVEAVTAEQCADGLTPTTTDDGYYTVA